MKTFISSTYVDLGDHRRAAAEAVERLGQQVGRMEVFGARPEEPSQVCLSEIDDCNLFVGIYAHRYGFVPNGSNVSITEAEFDHAKKRDKAVFCFVVNEDYPWPPRMIEDEPGKSKLRGLKAKISSGLIRDTFTSPEDLAFKIAAALGRYLADLERPGVPRSASHIEFFDRIFSELTSLRRELQGHTELLQRVQHVSDLLRTSNPTVEVSAAMSYTLPLDLEGFWLDSKTNTPLYARFVDGELIVPYCYGGNSAFKGVFFDFRKRSADVFFARFKWINSPIRGFAYIERSGSSRVTGGWWYSDDVPREALESLERFDPKLPRMNELALSRSPEPQSFPKWAEDIFSMPRKHLLK